MQDSAITPDFLMQNSFHVNMIIRKTAAAARASVQGINTRDRFRSARQGLGRGKK